MEGMSRERLESQLLAAVDGRKSADSVKNILDKMKSTGLNINRVKQTDGTPILHIAIHSVLEDPSVVFLLMDYGADPLRTDAKGHTALHKAASVDKTEILAAMMAGADINMQDNEGETLLHVAVRNRCIDTVEWLLFAGADPSVTNMRQQKSIHVAPRNCFQLKEVLRGERVSLPRPYFLGCGRANSVTAEDEHFSIALEDEGSDCRTAIMVRQLTGDDASVHVPHESRETVWGHPLEYKGTSEIMAILIFSLHDRVDMYHELVFRQKPELAEEVDTLAVVEEDDVVSEDDLEGSERVQKAHHSDDNAVENRPEKPRRVATARARLRLERKGIVGLVHRVKTDVLKVGPRGGHVQSSVDPRVEATVTVQGKELAEEQTLHLQIEKTPPLEIPTDPEEPAQNAEENPSTSTYSPSGDSLSTSPSTPSEESPTTSTDAPDPPAESSAPQGGQPVLMAMSPWFVKVTGKVGEKDKKRMELRVNLPLNEQFVPTVLALVYCRSSSREDTAVGAGDELQQEIQLWHLIPQVVSLDRTTSEISVQTDINSTTTVVQPAPGATQEEVRRAVAEHHLNCRDTFVSFYVFQRSSKDALHGQIHEVVVSVRASSPGQQGGCTRPKGYREVMTSASKPVPHNAYFRISALDKTAMLSQSSAEILFQYGIHIKCSSSCRFLVRGSSEGDATLVGFKVELRKMHEQKEDAHQWKYLLTLGVALDASIVEDGAPSQKSAPGESGIEKEERPETDSGAEEEIEAACSEPDHFLERLLASLAEKLPLDADLRLGLELGLSGDSVTRIIDTHRSENPAFRILLKARQKCSTTKAFVTRLFKALRNLELNHTVEWLRTQLKGFQLDWDHFEPLPNISSAATPASQS